MHSIYKIRYIKYTKMSYICSLSLINDSLEKEISIEVSFDFVKQIIFHKNN